MTNNNYLNKGGLVKDNQKGHKISAAIYLVTNHLSDTDPLKNALRSDAVLLISESHTISSSATRIHALLDVAVLAGLISEKNASIISLELKHYVITVTTEADSVSELFTPVFDTALPKHFAKQKPLIGMTYNVRDQSFTTHVKNPILNENKSKRQETILSYIRDHKAVGIKDIAVLFTDMSEKTVQRELGALVSAGKITKRGEKRWSVYMVV
jgi:hypothetical protein